MPGAEETCREENSAYAPTGNMGGMGNDIYGGMSYVPQSISQEDQLYDDSWQTEENFDAGSENLIMIKNMLFLDNMKI